jgi:hypothetical protein
MSAYGNFVHDHLPNNSMPNNSTLLLDFEDLIQSFRAWEAQRLASFYNFQYNLAEPLQCISVVYEDLQDNWKSNMRTIFQFLGVDDVSVKPTTVKQQHRPLSQIIHNMDDLKYILEMDTHYAHLLPSLQV